MQSFRCSVGGLDMCLNGGTCAFSDSGEQSCVSCNAGWGADSSFFRIPNCTLPDGLYLYNFIICTSICFFCALRMAWFFRQGLRSRVRKMCISYLIIIFLFALTSFVVYLQNGFYEGAIVCFLVWLLLMSFNARESILIMILPVVMTLNKPEVARSTTRKIDVFLTVTAIVCDIPLVGMLATARDENPFVFNSFAVAWYIIVPLMYFFGMVLLYVSADKLLGTFKQLGAASQVSDSIISRITALRHAFRANVYNPLLYAVAFGVPIAFAVLGSLPFYFIWLLVFCGINPIQFVGMFSVYVTSQQPQKPGGVTSSTSRASRGVTLSVQQSTQTV